MSIDVLSVSPEDARCYNKLILDYIQGSSKLDEFIKYTPSLSSFAAVIRDKQKETIPRNVLVTVLKEQYAGVQQGSKETVLKNIESLSDPKTFTVTTGHQPCLFTGPLYFIYKIVSTLNLASKLKKEFPENNFVPVYWLAGEDHDFAEINHAHIYGKSLEWNPEVAASGNKVPVGKMKLDSLSPVLELLRSFISHEGNGKQIYEAIQAAYYKDSDLTHALKSFLNVLFGEYGLVILNADDSRLKKEFVPVIKDDLFNGTPEDLVNQTIKRMEEVSITAQVNPRRINSFYFLNGLREKLEFRENRFVIKGTDVSFSKEEMETEIEVHPERFSPNVVLRPLYQEKILPNLAYIGGPGEIAYWFEYKKMFENYGVNFPVLMLRNSALWIDTSTSAKLSKLNIPIPQLFQETDQIVNLFLKKDDRKIPAGADALPVASAFDDILKRVEYIDESLKASVEAERQRYLNGLKLLEEKILRAKKKKEEVSVNQIKTIKEKLFPGNAMQERHDNFIPFYIKYGKDFFAKLIETFDPLNKNVIVFQEKEE